MRKPAYTPTSARGTNTAAAAAASSGALAPAMATLRPATMPTPTSALARDAAPPKRPTMNPAAAALHGAPRVGGALQGADALREFLDGFFAGETLAHWLAWLEDIDVCYAPLRSLHESLTDPATTARGMRVSDEAGLPMLGVPILYRNEPGRAGGHVPGRSEHGAAIARELGFDEVSIASLLADGVIRPPLA